MNADSERLLTIDLGTTSCKVSLFAPDGARTGSCEAAYPLASPEPGAAEQDPAWWQAALWQTLGKLADQQPEQMRAVAGIGLTAQMNSLVLLDASGNPLGTALSSLDQRSVPHSARLRQEFAKRGLSNYAGYNGTLGRILWLREQRSKQFSSSAHLLDARGLVNFWLTGEMGVDASIGVRAWTGELATALGCPPEKLPPVYLPWQAAGRLRPELARRFYLPEGASVVIGSGDGACANLGVGAIHPGQGCISLGTTGVLRAVLLEPLPVASRIPSFSYPFLGSLWLGGAFYPAGACLQWLRSWLAPSVPTEAGEAWLQALLPDASRLPPGAEGLVFLPFLFGQGQAEEEKFASLQGLRFSHRPAHLLRAVLEGTAFALRSGLEFLEGRGGSIPDWRATGGGMRLPLWRQIVADVLERPLRLTNGDSSLGAALLAAIGAGLYPDLPAAVAAMVQTEVEINPEAQGKPAYRRVYTAYQEAGLPVET